jgi:hypothetical protein
MMSAAASAIVAWTLTPPRHGVGVQGDQRQLEAREPGKNQLTLEASTIILTGTQLLCAGSLHAGAHAAISETPIGGTV